MEQPKVLIGAPISEDYDYCLNDLLAGINSLDYPNFDVLLVDNSKDETFFNKLKNMNLNIKRIQYYKEARDRMVVSRNLLREHALSNGYEYLLSLDADIVLNKDTLSNLVSYKKPLLTAIYFRILIGKDGRKNMLPMIFKRDEKDPNFIKAMKYVPKPGLLSVDMCGLGCILIHKSVLEKIKFRYDKGFDDEAFCIDALNNNFKIYADTKTICKHMFLNRPWDWKDFNISEK